MGAESAGLIPGNEVAHHSRVSASVNHRLFPLNSGEYGPRQGGGTVGWARTTDLRIHNPAL